MNFSCVSQVGYLATPQFLTFSLHFTTILVTPIHLLGFTFILLKTPEQMRTVKWYLFTLHFWTVTFDITITCLIIPFMLIPEMAAIVYGLLDQLAVPVFYQAIWGFGCLGAVLISIVSIFENRFFILCSFSFKKSWLFWRKPWLGMHYLVAATGLWLTISPPEQQSARILVFQKLPCLPDYIYNGPVFVLDLDYKLTATFFTVFIVFLSIEYFIFVLALTWNAMQILSKCISPKMFRMQKQFIVALVIQVGVPLTMLCVPFLYAAVTFIVHYYNQTATNLFVLTASAHGLASTIVMLLVHKPYREELCYLLFRDSSCPLSDWRQKRGLRRIVTVHVIV